jgi:membrane associated rhomboid family serine protease
LTSTLPHLDIFHLSFNLVWTAVFGVAIERAFGSGRTLALYAVLAATSGLAEFALFRGGVGLSGVGYGLFGLLWMLKRQGHPLGAVLEPAFVPVFIGWFFLCLVLTMAGVWNIANVAHGAGALFGILIGLGVPPGRRHYWGLGVVLAAAIALAAGPFRPRPRIRTYRISMRPTAPSEPLLAGPVLGRVRDGLAGPGDALGVRSAQLHVAVRIACVDAA